MKIGRTSIKNSKLFWFFYFIQNGTHITPDSCAYLFSGGGPCGICVGDPLPEDCRRPRARPDRTHRPVWPPGLLFPASFTPPFPSATVRTLTFCGCPVQSYILKEPGNPHSPWHQRRPLQCPRQTCFPSARRGRCSHDSAHGDFPSSIHPLFQCINCDNTLAT